MGRPKRHCEIDGCGRDAVGWGMCKTHWQRWRRWGDPRHVGSRWTLSATDRFWQHVDKSGPCWQWTASKKNGYGCYWPGEDMVMAHRHAYELANGPIDEEGMTLDHACHTAAMPDCQDGPACPHRACVRPDHLVPMPLSDNIRLGGNSAKTHCKRGHEFTEANTYMTKAGSRLCRECNRMHAAALRARRRAGS